MPSFRSRLRSATSLVLASGITMSGQAASAQDFPWSLEIDHLNRPAHNFAQTTPAATAPQAPVAGSNMPWLLLGGLAVGAAIAVGVGGGGDDGDTPDPVDPGPTDPDPEPGPVDPAPVDPNLQPEDFETAEYRRDYTLGMINASTRYAAGGTGQGVLLGVYDTGADVGHADLPNITYTHSYFSSNGDVTDYNGHGTHVAATIAGAKNDFGGHGVAFDSDLAVFQGVSWEGSPQRLMGSRDALADATRRAADMGAVAMNHSWVFLNENDTTRLISEFSGRQDLRYYLGSNLIDALDASVDAGMVSVFATGNDGADNVSVLAGIPYYMPEYADNILAVGAVNSRGQIADFSNRCGVAMDVCLVAPGVSVYAALSSDSGRAENSFGYMSGTSMATPHVTGAIGVVASNFPELTGDEISRILRETATDLGAPGIDEIFGNGLLNLENAVAPQGEIVIKTGTDIHEGEIALADSWVGGGAVADGLASALAGTEMMVADHYDRGYSLDLGSAVSTNSSDFEEKTSKLARFANPSIASGADAPGLSVMAEGVDARTMGKWADAGVLSSAYADLADSPIMDFSSETPFGMVSLRSSIGADSSYASAELEAPVGRGHSLTFEAGHLTEKGGFLGTIVSGAFGAELSSATSFARVAGEARLAPQTSLHASASLGLTDFASSGILAQGADIASQAIGFGIETRSVFGTGDSLTIGLSQPLTMSGGRLTLDAPVSMSASDGSSRSTTVYRDRMEIDLGAGRAPTDLQMGYSTDFFGGRANIGGVWRSGDSKQLGIAAGVALAF